jgi:hypothetical protein
MATVPNVSDIRNSPDNQTVLSDLGLLAELAGTWEGHGFNLIARPDFVQGTNLFLQLSDTDETLKFDPIGSPIPNRIFGPNPAPPAPPRDLKLNGLTYLQKIHDAQTGGALHIEPGIWIRQPNTNYPPETAPKGQDLIARMGNIPHGNSLLAQGIASSFEGDPVLANGNVLYNGSVFPSFNSTPFPIPPLAIPPAPQTPTVLNAALSSEKGTAPNPPGPFTQYDLTIAASAANTRTSPPPPGVNQAVVNDPITLLQNVITQQKQAGHSFSGTVLNIATQAEITFFTQPNSQPGAATTPVNVPNGAGGIENILFLLGGNPAGSLGPNAQTALVYATFWIEKVTHPTDPTFMQLQYAQMVVLNFEILKALPKSVLLGWPHVSVGTLRKTFN